MTLRYIVGADILASDAGVLCNTVNCDGYMGKGLALQVKGRWPGVMPGYTQACRTGALRPGMILPYRLPGSNGKQVIWHIATKDHWRPDSQLVWITNALARIVAKREYLRGKSIALPPLGCGNGGLSWAVVGPLMAQAARDLGGEVDVRIYVPRGWQQY